MARGRIWMTTAKPVLAAAAAFLWLAAGGAQAAERTNAGKLLLTAGVSTVEGSGGGGLATWATTTGYGTRDGFGANVHATYVGLPDYELKSWGVAGTVLDRVEVSYARQAFDTGGAGAKLGLGKGFTFHQDVVGAKVRLVGDAVYDQDRWLPQISIGAQYKKNDRAAIIKAVGGQDDHGVDYYVAATKVLLAQSLVLNGAVRATKANQLGLLGFGGKGKNDYSAQVEGSAAYLVNRKLAVGGEYRTKPDNLAFAKENDWYDLFAAYTLNKHLSATLAYVDLGAVATFKNQRGLYLSLQAGF
jgi:hypothetical protein